MDGFLTIGSRIDTRGFNAGISSMLGRVRTLAVAVAAAFAAIGIGRFAKSAVDEASKMASALVGLESVATGTGNSFAGAQEFIKDFVADGLVPATDAITAYKNLLLRGYDTTQIEQTLTALKDSAAFGRQGQLTMGEAINRASEGLKNENSLLVDNAGVTKNVAAMWRDYARSIGTSVENLTKAQKIQAEVNGILEETRFQTGDAAKAANTYGGQISALGVSILNLRIAIGNVLIPIIVKILPYIRAAIDALTVYFNRLATIVSIFFGVDISAASKGTEQVTESTQDASAAQEDLAGNIKKTEKAVKGALAAFDELNVLQQPEADTSGEVTTPAIKTPAVDLATTDESLAGLTERVSNFKTRLLELLAPALEAFGRLKEALAPLGALIIEGLGWAWHNILVPFGKWAIESFLPRFFDLVSAAVRFVTAAFIALKPVLIFIWDNIFKPFAQTLGWIIINILEIWAASLNKIAAWLEQNPDIFKNLVEYAKVAWDSVKLFVLNAWKATLAIWGGVGTWFMTNVTGPIQRAFGTMTDWIRTKFGPGLFSGVSTAAKQAFNGVIDSINGLLSRIVSGINLMAGIANSLNFFGPDIPTVNAPRIPYLASGAVIPPNSEFLAVLGDQRGGRNIEAPEGLIRQIIRDEMGGIEANISISFNGSLGELVRLLKPHIDREDVRVGQSVMRGSTT